MGAGADMIGSVCSVSAADTGETSLCDSGGRLNGTGVGGGVVIQGGGDEGEGNGVVVVVVAAAFWIALRCTRCFWARPIRQYTARMTSSATGDRERTSRMPWTPSLVNGLGSTSFIPDE